jgi:hypothetical protein
MERLAGEPHTRVRNFCSPQHTDSAGAAAGFAHDDTAQAKLHKLDALLVQSFTPRHDAALIAKCCHCRTTEPYVTALTLNRLGEREITAMIDRVTGNKVLPLDYQTRHY